MSGAWSSQFTASVVGGLTIFALLLIPVLIVQHQRYGRLSPVTRVRRWLGMVVDLSAFVAPPP